MSKPKGAVTYNTEDLEKQAIAIIEAKSLVFIDEVCAYLPCSMSTFYERKLEKSEVIKAALTKNRVSKKLALRSNWEESTNATLQMGLYKLLATPDELAALSMQQIDHTTKGESLNQEKRITFSDGSIRDENGNITALPPALQPPD